MFEALPQFFQTFSPLSPRWSAGRGRNLVGPFVPGFRFAQPRAIYILPSGALRFGRSACIGSTHRQPLSRVHWERVAEATAVAEAG